MLKVSEVKTGLDAVHCRARCCTQAVYKARKVIVTKKVSKIIQSAKISTDNIYLPFFTCLK